jgi:short-subunit dehydrogenase
LLFDFKKKGEWKEYEELCNHIKDITKEKEISILVNNVEQFDPYGQKIHKADDEEILETLQANTFPMVFMSRFLGPELKARQSPKKGAIINMTSYYSDYPVYNLPIFSSAKSFEDVFSQTLGYEN